MEELMRLANQELICITWYEIGQYSDSELDEFARQKLVKPLDETSTFLGTLYWSSEFLTFFHVNLILNLPNIS